MRERRFLVCSLSFDAEASLETTSELFSTFVQAFCPNEGLHVRVTRGTRREVLPARFSQTATVKAAQLARGGSVELSAGSSFALPGDPVFWIASQPEDEVKVRVGLCLERPRRSEAEAAVALAASTLVEAATELEGCAAAVVSVQPEPRSVDEDVLEMQGHAHAVTWRMLVPSARMRALPRPPPPGVTLVRVPGGVLVKRDVESPFADADARFEAWLAHAQIA